MKLKNLKRESHQESVSHFGRRGRPRGKDAAGMEPREAEGQSGPHPFPPANPVPIELIRKYFYGKQHSILEKKLFLQYGNIPDE